MEVEEDLNKNEEVEVDQLVCNFWRFWTYGQSRPQG